MAHFRSVKLDSRKMALERRLYIFFIPTKSGTRNLFLLFSHRIEGTVWKFLIQNLKKIAKVAISNLNSLAELEKVVKNQLASFLDVVCSKKPVFFQFCMRNVQTVPSNRCENSKNGLPVHDLVEIEYIDVSLGPFFCLFSLTVRKWAIGQNKHPKT